MFGAILALLLCINGMNVVSSYVGRDLMTAIERRDTSRFVSMLLLYALMFGALTLAAVVLRFIEERLGLLWRQWLTGDLLGRYLDRGVYLHLKEQRALTNPDQRISDDVRAFTSNTLSFVLMFLNALFAIVAFSGVMWSVSRLLFLVAVGYALLGSLCSVVLGKPLVRLNYDQSDREASFRSELLHIAENAESVALLQLEGRLDLRLRRRLDALVHNARRIISVNRNLSFFTTGYNYGIQLVPPLIVGPLFMRGRVEFGVITQAAIAFAQLLGAFSLIVTQFQQLSSYAAVLVRVGTFSATIEGAAATGGAQTDVNPTRDRIVYDDVTLRSTSNLEPLVTRLTLAIPVGMRVLVTGTDEARRALFHATSRGHALEGRIVGAGVERTLFVPERPYVPAGTLRELLVRVRRGREISDEQIYRVLQKLDLEATLRRLGGLDVERDWTQVLSLGEQQLLALARVALDTPAFVFLQSPGSTLAPEQLTRALTLLTEYSVTYVALGSADVADSWYDAVLELHAGGAWSFGTRPALDRATHATGT
jgi:putative ATP-binding cassette transporter